MLTLRLHPQVGTSADSGPSPVPDRIPAGHELSTIDHRGPEFAALGLKLLADIKKIFKTEQPVVNLSASGTGRLGSRTDQYPESPAMRC